LLELLSNTGLVLTIILVMLASIYLLVLVILIIRLTQQIRENKEKKFVKNWEDVIFEYLSEDKNPHEIINLLPVSRYKYLLMYLRNHFLTLKGSDWKKLSDLVIQTKLYDYLLSQLKSRRIKKIIFGAYYLGLAKSEKANLFLLDKLKHRNQMVFLACALSLARISKVDSLDSILNQAAKFKNLSRDTLLSIIIEFNNNICENLLHRFNSETSPLIKSIILSALRYFKYFPAASDILQVLVKAESNELVLESLKFFSETGYLDVSTALRFCLLNSNPDIKIEAIRAAERVSAPVLEDRIWSLIYDKHRNVKIAAAEAMYNYSSKSREKLKQLAYSIPNTKESSVARMILSEKNILPNL
jgi:hypothetical protein